ncbi:MAG: hypothetical protein QM688_01400 [Sphingomonas bacterium]
MREVMGGSSKLDAERGLRCYHPHPRAHGVRLGGVDIGLLVQKLEFLRGRWRRRQDFFVLERFGFATDAGIGGIAVANLTAA